MLRPISWLPRLSLGLTITQLSARLRCAECGGQLHSIKPWRWKTCLASRGGCASKLVVIWPAAPASANQSISVAVCSLNVTRRRWRLSRLVSYAVGNVGVLRVVRATFRPVLRAVRATFRPVLRAVRVVLRAVRAVLRAVRFVVAIVFLPALSRIASLFADFAVAHGKSITFYWEV